MKQLTIQVIRVSYRVSRRYQNPPAPWNYLPYSHWVSYRVLRRYQDRHHHHRRRRHHHHRHRHRHFGLPRHALRVRANLRVLP